VLSTTMCTTPYRSAGRPEVIYVIERLIDKAAQEHGFDRIRLRRRNLIPLSAAVVVADALRVLVGKLAYRNAGDAGARLAGDRISQGGQNASILASA
jgi:CO/xanthine dehydrogenase Mo-binding subunit